MKHMIESPTSRIRDNIAEKSIFEDNQIIVQVGIHTHLDLSCENGTRKGDEDLANALV